jgi:hypothetical protein
MVEKINTEEVANTGEQMKTPEQQEKEKMKLLGLILEKNPAFWEEDYKDVLIADMVAMVEAASPELKKEIIGDLIEKYYDDCEMGKESNIFIEAPHGRLPSLAETKLVIGQYDKFKDVNPEIIEGIFNKLDEELFGESESSEKTFTKVRSELKAKCTKSIEEREVSLEKISQSEFGNKTGREQFMNEAAKDLQENKLKLAMLKIMAGSDIYVSELAVAIAGGEHNYTNPAVSRKTDDPNKEPGNRIIKKLTKRLESGHGGALAQHYVLQQIMENNKNTAGVKDNFYHVTLLERDSREPFTIGIASHDGELPWDITVAGYIITELKVRLQKAGVTKKNGKEYEVVRGGDKGNAFKGAKVNVDRRFGKGKFKGMGLGEKYNSIQLAIPSLAIKNHGDKIAKILKEILQELA